MSTASATRGVRLTTRTRAFSWMIRGGFAARALTYGLIGGLSLALALGAGREPVAADQQGALALIAKAPLGRLAISLIAVGLLAYAIWKLVQAIYGRGPEGGGGTGAKDRLANAGGGIAYLAFFGVAVSVLAGSESDSSAPRETAAGVLGWPAGPELIAIAGIGLLLISLYQIADAWRLGFLRDNKTEGMGVDEREMFVHFGRVGLIARSLVFALVGYFLVRTAIEFSPGKAVGVDGALYRVYDEPYGPWLLGFVAAGLLVFAVFSVFEARHRQL